MVKLKNIYEHSEACPSMDDSSSGVGSISRDPTWAPLSCPEHISLTNCMPHKCWGLNMYANTENVQVYDDNSARCLL